MMFQLTWGDPLWLRWGAGVNRQSWVEGPPKVWWATPVTGHEAGDEAAHGRGEVGRDGGGKPRDVLGVNPDLLWELGGSYEERTEVGLFPALVRVSSYCPLTAH